MLGLQNFKNYSKININKVYSENPGIKLTLFQGRDRSGLGPAAILN
jgi:hypothetical protein